MGSAFCIHNATVIAGYARMDRSAVLVEGNLIADIFSERRFAQKTFAPDVELIDAEGAYLTPGLIDTHIHGIGGYGTEDMSADSILGMSKMLPAWGVTSFVPTIYPMPEEDMLRAVRAIVSAMGREEGAEIIGVHMEGPFISPAQLGVQRVEFVRPVDLGLMQRLWDASEGHIVSMTVAPELKGMRELALFCNRLGIVLQAGHTDASYENMIEGMQAGIRHSTHMFNAMSRLHHRNPNAVGAVLIQPDLSCEIIADGLHVHPDLIRLLFRDKPEGNIVLVTDSLKPTKQATDAPMFANEEEVYLTNNLFFRASDGVIAGSSLTMIEGVRNLISFGVPLESAVKMASANPARIFGLRRRGMISPGFQADLLLANNKFEAQMTIIDGIIKYRRSAR
ncbi:N-acetylglucosamine-6-phosphate deacetylase [uncultured spirochete]|jgi:N-acetylglucosamine-6-phosphate deacetylase|uniref:N-acetylglucosamine-6-phosphate deacetylase n=1 Tax=uncultured spirochete TaxID=156406 RepID=A0A3P3XQT1_9SPIR|nr:N-acetylglucosamine-6-phosphate deacetylase [uncultured spirochete]